MLGSFGVLSVEFRYKSLCASNIFRQSPFVFFDAVSLPPYKVFKFPSKDPTIQDMFHFIFFDPVMNDWGWRVMLNSFSDSVHMKGCSNLGAKSLSVSR